MTAIVSVRADEKGAGETWSIRFDASIASHCVYALALLVMLQLPASWASAQTLVKAGQTGVTLTVDIENASDSGTDIANAQVNAVPSLGAPVTNIQVSPAITVPVGQTKTFTITFDVVGTANGGDQFTITLKDVIGDAVDPDPGTQDTTVNYTVDSPPSPQNPPSPPNPNQPPYPQPNPSMVGPIQAPIGADGYVCAADPNKIVGLQVVGLNGNQQPLTYSPPTTSVCFHYSCQSAGTISVAFQNSHGLSGPTQQCAVHFNSRHLAPEFC